MKFHIECHQIECTVGLLEMGLGDRSCRHCHLQSGARRAIKQRFDCISDFSLSHSLSLSLSSSYHDKCYGCVQADSKCNQDYFLYVRSLPQVAVTNVWSSWRGKDREAGAKTGVRREGGREIWLKVSFSSAVNRSGRLFTTVREGEAPWHSFVCHIGSQ